MVALHLGQSNEKFSIDNRRILIRMSTIDGLIHTMVPKTLRARALYLHHHPPIAMTSRTEMYVRYALMKLLLASHGDRRARYCREMCELCQNQKPIQAKAIARTIPITGTSRICSHRHSGTPTKNQTEKLKSICDDQQILQIIEIITDCREKCDATSENLMRPLDQPTWHIKLRTNRQRPVICN